MNPSTSTLNEGVGMIIPPPEVRELLEKTATYIANKPSLEIKVKERHSNDIRFTFLHKTNPYHSYYQHRVLQLRNQQSNETAQQPEIKQPSIQEKETEIEGAKISYLKSFRAKSESARQQTQTKQQYEDIYTIPDISPRPTTLSLEVMKLTARYGAEYGIEFIRNISIREQRNHTFDFLKPMHVHFAIFQKLMDSYVHIMKLGRTCVDKDLDVEIELNHLNENNYDIMNDVWNLHDWDCQQAERQLEADLNEREKFRKAQIDWHDFIVVATVDFKSTEDEDEADEEEILNVPVSDARLLPKMLAAARKEVAEREKNKGDIDMDLDGHNNNNNNNSKDTRVELGNVDSDIPIDRIRSSLNNNGNVEKEKIEVTNGDGKEKGKEASVVLPSGQKVPLSKAEQFVKVELLDRSYKNERARAAEKSRVRNLAGGDEVARHLARWDQAHSKEGEVYNRGDLQQVVIDRRRNDDNAEQEDEQEEEEGEEGRALKKARVDKAVDVLLACKDKNKLHVQMKDDDGEGGEGDEDDGDDAERDADRKGMVGGEEWIRQIGDKVNIIIRVCKYENSNEEWALRGQEMKIKAPLKSNVFKLKQVLTKLTKLPMNKQKLQIVDSNNGGIFMKDNLSLAHYNLNHATVIQLDVKERGGKKKIN